MKNIFKLNRKKLANNIRYAVLRTGILDNPGLYDGKLGMAILFYEYSRYSCDLLYEQFADEIIDSIIELPSTLSFRFSDGLTGIGWGITYLLKKKFIEGNIDDILSEIDKKLLKVEIKEKTFIKDYHTYINIRKNYIIPHEENLLKPYYSDIYILKQIWESCCLTKNN